MVVAAAQDPAGGNHEEGAALAVLTQGLARPRAPLDLYARQAALLATGRPFTEINRELGFSERQLRRRVEHAVGYGPRTLARVVRLQRFLGGAEYGLGASLTRLAADAGFPTRRTWRETAADETKAVPDAPTSGE